MPITVEDGTGLSTADAYVDLDGANAFIARDPFLTAWAALADDVKENYIAKAAELIDAAFVFDGVRAFAVQALAWPRNGVEFDGVVYTAPDIPPQIAKANALYAATLAQYGNPETAADDQRGIKSFEVDVIKITFDPTDRKQQFPDTLVALLSQFGEKRCLESGVVKLIRA